MSRRRAQQTAAVQLFPFLDVLLSAMGALILLLAVASRNLSKQEADLAANAPAAEELRVRREMVEWEIEQLKVQRDKTAGDLAEQRQQLGHLERHTRQLRSELEEILRAEEQLAAQSSGDLRAEKETELRELRSRLAAAKHELETALAEQQTSGSAYAIVPYQGPNETRRRPIYIECRANEIVIQPEGVVLTAKDFDGPLGPGNPLAAAVRAAREHLNRTRGSQSEDEGEPYPLMLVRPDGIETFYAARAALDSWGSEFGYEFIEADWKVKYQPADTELATVEQDAVDTAREQMRLVAQFAPRSNRNVTARTYRASKAGGGIVAEDGGGPPRRSFGNDGSSGGFSPYRSPGSSAAGGGFAESGPDSGTAPGGRYGDHRYASDRYGGDRYGSARHGSEFGGAGGGEYGGGSGGSGASTPYRSALENVQSQRTQGLAGGVGGMGNPLSGGGGTGTSGTGGEVVGGNESAFNGSDRYAQRGNGAGGPEGGAMSGGASGSSTGGATGTGGSGDVSSQAATEGPQFPPAANGASGGNAANGGAAGSADGQGIVGVGGGAGSPPAGATSPGGVPSVGMQFGQPENGSNGQPETRGEQFTSRGGPPPNAFDSAGRPRGNYQSSSTGRSSGPKYGKRPAHQGENWALPESPPSSVPLSRPIRVQCREDRLTVFGERGGRAPTRVIELGPDTGASVDEFVAAVREQMDTWGIAGDGFYWHPIVKLETVGNGAARASELKALMAGSGLEFRDPPAGDSVRRAMSHTLR
ncbi:MAG: hypothetical protein JNG90_19045 [Planctomycetaceae bacterium]|nr:hypothetical protein [Planctomycetaceae bacterium]